MSYGTGNVQISTVVPYLGELFQTTKRPNALLKLLGGLHNGVVEATSKEFPIGAFWNVQAPSQPARLEGAAAPAAVYHSLTQATNVVQLFQEAIQITYLAASDRAVAGVVPIPQGEANLPLQNPRTQEFQVMATLEKIAQDANYSFLNGTYANPGDPSASALATRGIHTAITTNAVDETATTTPTAAQYRGFVHTLLSTIIQQTGYAVDDTWTLMAGVNEYSNICAAFEAQGTLYLTPESTVFGVRARQIRTRFGDVNVVLEPDMPAQYFDAFNLGVARIVGLPVPGKGILFEEPLFKQGSADQTQIYGQLGIDHGPEWMHGSCHVAANIAL